MERPSIRQLEYLVAVDKHLNFREAAESCHVTQPALSTQLQQLEALLGVQLFERDTRRVVATAAGTSLAEQARKILGSTDEMLDMARASGAPLTGRLRLGAIPTVAPYLLPMVVRAAREKHPDLVLLLTEDQTDRIVAKLHSGELDVLLLALDVDVRGAEEMQLFGDPFVLACRDDHDLATKEMLSEEDLEGETVLLLEEGHCLRAHALPICKSSGMTEYADFRATSLGTLLQMVGEGIGITLVPEMAVEAESHRNQSVVFRPFDEGGPSRRIGLAWRKSSARRDEFEALGETIRAAFLAS
ncbi:MAG: LysR substrate-binding domain-containing protein [Planctomycetota bacterium]